MTTTALLAWADGAVLSQDGAGRLFLRLLGNQFLAYFAFIFSGTSIMWPQLSQVRASSEA